MAFQRQENKQEILKKLPDIPKMSPDIPKKVPDYPKKDAWRLSGMFSGSFWDSKKHAWQLAVQKSIDQLDDCQAAFLGSSGTFLGIVVYLFWDCGASFLGLSVVFFGTSRIILGY